MLKIVIQCGQKWQKSLLEKVTISIFPIFESIFLKMRPKDDLLFAKNSLNTFRWVTQYDWLRWRATSNLARLVAYCALGLNVLGDSERKKKKHIPKSVLRLHLRAQSRMESIPIDLNLKKAFYFNVTDHNLGISGPILKIFSSINIYAKRAFQWCLFKT